MLNFFKKNDKDIKLDVSGNWVGHYMYDPVDNPFLKDKKLYFKLILEEENQLIFGEFIDFQTKTESRFYGQVQGKFIKFNMSSDSQLVFNDKGELVIDKTCKILSIKHEGEYLPFKQKFLGLWTVEFELGGNLQKSSGFWEMERE